MTVLFINLLYSETCYNEVEVYKHTCTFPTVVVRSPWTRSSTPFVPSSAGMTKKLLRHSASPVSV